MMISNYIVGLSLTICIGFISCRNHPAQEYPKTVYQSNHLVIQQLTENSYQHISYLQTNDFGNVPCNGVFIIQAKNTVIIDAPTNDTASLELTKFITHSLNSKIQSIVATHFHNDCIGGLKTFHHLHIPSIALQKTIDLISATAGEIPRYGFKNDTSFLIGKAPLHIKFFGEGHTSDNTVAYFPKDELLFGGCLIKELNANKGFLGDANVEAWSTTVQEIKSSYPNLKWVIPGHGIIGDTSLLDYTINLFKH